MILINDYVKNIYLTVIYISL